jgi:hypothetical protein
MGEPGVQHGGPAPLRARCTTMRRPVRASRAAVENSRRRRRLGFPPASLVVVAVGIGERQQTGGQTSTAHGTRTDRHRRRVAPVLPA